MRREPVHRERECRISTIEGRHRNSEREADLSSLFASRTANIKERLAVSIEVATYDTRIDLLLQDILLSHHDH